MTESVAETLIKAFVANEPEQFRAATEEHMTKKWAKHGVPDGELQTAKHMAAKAALNL